VDLVTIFAEAVPLPALQIVRAEIYVKGGDYDMAAIPETRLVTTWGGRALAIPFEHLRSTSGLLARVRGSASK
jgi:bifunctional ADP-heptose synthase (sugar kinase/adenylyltransferase)